MSRQNFLRSASHVGVIGSSGQGKTGYVERYVAGSNHSRVFIFDWQSEFFERLGVEPCVTWAELFTRTENNRLCVFDPTVHFSRELPDTFDAFCEYVLGVTKENQKHYGESALFVVDEIQRLISPNLTPPPLKEILQTGRRSGLDSCMISQQPNKVHNEIRIQWTEVVCFQMQDRTVSELLENWGFQLEEIAKLPAKEYRWKNTRTGEARSGKIVY